MRTLVLPTLGKVSLADLTHQDCQRGPRCCATRGQSSGNIHGAYRVLRAVLGAAVKVDEIGRNLARDLRLKVSDKGKEDMRCLDFAELEAVVAAVGTVDPR